MTKSNLKNSGVHNGTDTSPEESKLDEDEEMGKKMERTVFGAPVVEGKTYVCDKCFSIWSDEVLDILFRGTDTVTVNSKITYGAVVRFFEWAKEHLGRFANEAVETLLFRADIGDNLRFLQIENLDEELTMLLKEGDIICCSVFLLIYQPHEVVSKIMPENTPRISLKYHIYSFESKQSGGSLSSPASRESLCKETSAAERSSSSRKEVAGPGDSESEGVDTESAFTDVPENASVTGVSERTSVMDVPENTCLADVPESTSVADTPESTPTADAPRSASVTDGQKSTSVTDIPKSTPAKDVPESTPVIDVPESASITDMPESTPVTDVPEITPVADVSEGAPVTDAAQASPVQSQSLEKKQASPVMSPRAENEQNERTESKDYNVKDGDDGKELKRSSSSTESKDSKDKDSGDGQEMKKSSSSPEKVSKPPSSAPLGKTGDQQEGKIGKSDGSDCSAESKVERKESLVSSDTPEEPPSLSTSSKESMLKSSSEQVGNSTVSKSPSSISKTKSIALKDDKKSIQTPGDIEGNKTPEENSNKSHIKVVENVPQGDKGLQSTRAKRKTRSSDVDPDQSFSPEGSQSMKRRKVESGSKKEPVSDTLASPLSTEKNDVRDDKIIKDAEKNEIVRPRRSIKEPVSDMLASPLCTEKNDVRDDKIIKDAEKNETVRQRRSMTKIAQTPKEDKIMNKGNEQVSGKLASPLSTKKNEVKANKTVKDAETDEKVRPRRSTTRIAQSPTEDNFLNKGNEPVSDVLASPLSTKKNEVRDDKTIKDAETNEKVRPRRSITKIAPSPKEDNLLNKGNIAKEQKIKEKESLPPVYGADERVESHGTYQKPYVTRADDRIQRRRRSENLQDSTDGEENYSLKKRVDSIEKKQEKIESSERKRKRNESDTKEYPDEESFNNKTKRVKDFHIPEKNIIQTRRRSKGSTGPVVSKKVAALLTETDDSGSEYELSSEIDDLSEPDEISYQEPSVKKIQNQMKRNKLMYTKALESVKEFDVNYVKKLSYKDMGDLVVNVSSIDFSQFDGPQSNRRGITKEWLKSPVPKNVAVSNGMILELFEYLYKRMTVIKVLSVMFWLLRKLDSKLQTSNSKQVKDAVALVIKESEAMDEDMFNVYRLMPFKPTNVRYINQTGINVKDVKRIPYLTFANGEMLFLHNHLVLNPTNPDPVRFYDLIRSFMDLRNTVLLVPDSQTLVQIGESVRKEFYAQRLAGTEQEFVCKEWDCKKLFRTGKPAQLQTKVKVRDILAHFMKWKNAVKEDDGVLKSAIDLNRSVEGLFDKSLELRGIITSSRFDKVGFCFQLYAKYCDIVFLQKSLKSGLEFLESYTGLDEILFFQSRRKLKSQCHTEQSWPGSSEDVGNEENINVSHLKSQISTLSNELAVHNNTAKHSESKMKELLKKISHLKKGIDSEQSQLISEFAKVSVTLQGKKERRKTSVPRDFKKRGQKASVPSRVCSAIKDLVANDVPVDEIRHIIEVIMENIVGEEPYNVPDNDWIHKYVKELDTSCEMD